MEQSFEKLNKALVTPPVLAYPYFDNPFIVETGASNVGVGALLAHKRGEVRDYPIQYALRKMTKV